MSNTSAETVRVVVHDIAITNNQTIPLDSLFGGERGSKIVGKTLSEMPQLVSPSDPIFPWMSWKRVSSTTYQLTLNEKQIDAELRKAGARSASIDLEVSPEAIRVTPRTSFTSQSNATKQAEAGLRRTVTRAVNHVYGMSVMLQRREELQEKTNVAIKMESQVEVDVQAALREAKEVARRQRIEMRVQNVQRTY